MSRCKIAPNKRHKYTPVESRGLVRSEYLDADVARWWECEWCGKSIEFEGRYAITVRAKR